LQCLSAATNANGKQNGQPVHETVRGENGNSAKYLSGPIKSESFNPLIYRGPPKIRESKKQRIMSRFSPKTKIHESIAQTHTMLRPVGRVAC
jgi:hypothetical protein